MLELRLPAPRCREAVLPAIRARADAVSGDALVLADGTIRVVVALPRPTAA